MSQKNTHAAAIVPLQVGSESVSIGSSEPVNNNVTTHGSEVPVAAPTMAEWDLNEKPPYASEEEAPAVAAPTVAKWDLNEKPPDAAEEEAPAVAASAAEEDAPAVAASTAEEDAPAVDAPAAEEEAPAVAASAAEEDAPAVAALAAEEEALAVAASALMILLDQNEAYAEEEAPAPAPLVDQQNMQVAATVEEAEVANTIARKRKIQKGDEGSHEAKKGKSKVEDMFDKSGNPSDTSQLKKTATEIQVEAGAEVEEVVRRKSARAKKPNSLLKHFEVTMPKKVSREKKSN